MLLGCQQVAQPRLGMNCRERARELILSHTECTLRFTAHKCEFDTGLPECWNQCREVLVATKSAALPPWPQSQAATGDASSCSASSPVLPDGEGTPSASDVRSSSDRSTGVL